MLSVSEKYSQAIKADVRRMLHRVTLANSVVLDQASVPKMTLDENIGGNSGVSLGTANSASLKLTLKDPAVIDYTDMYVEPESGIELPDGTIEWMPLGKFWVTDSSTSNDYKTVELTCADGMYLMSGEYVSELTYPAHVRDVTLEIVSQAGVDFVEPAEWPAVMIRKKPEKITLRNAIGYVAGCCGKNARFNRYGSLEFVWYKDTGLTIEREQQYLDGFTRLNDQPLNVNFNVTGEEERYKVTVVADGNGNVIANPGTNIKEGDTVTLTVVPLFQYELLSITATTSSGVAVSLWQNADGSEYTFTQPDSDVTVNVAFQLSENASSGSESGGESGGGSTSGGEYSFLQHPSLAAPPYFKRYWAIFYKHSYDVGANGKYYLVWFSDWSVTSKTTLSGDKAGYYIAMESCYYCQGTNSGRKMHSWDDSEWLNAENLSWRSGIGRWCDGYGLIASNVSLYYDDTLIFEHNEDEISTTQSDWLVGEYDVREKGAFDMYACPDSLGGAYWMLTNRAQIYAKNADGSFSRLFNGTDIYALSFDNFAVSSLGNYYSDDSDDFFKFTFSSLKVVPYQMGGEFYSSATKTIDQECYIVIRDTDYSSLYKSGGSLENACGLIAANFTVRQVGLYFYNNSPMVCDCASAASEPMMFAMRRSAGANVTIEYTNPLITSKMVDGISAVVGGVSYTPSKVKHRGNPALEAGDIVTVPDKDGSYHTVLIIQQTMVFGGGMNATITCPGQTEKKTNFSTTGALNTQIKKVVQEESYYQKNESNAYNSMVVSALSRSMSSLSRQVSADGVTIKSLNEWRGVASATLAELSVRVDDVEAEIRSTATWFSETDAAIASLRETANEQGAEIEAIVEWEGETEKSIASVRETANANKSEIESIAKWQGETDASLTLIRETATSQGAEIEAIAKWQGETDDTLASIKQTADEQGASIELLVEDGEVKGSVLIEAINGESVAKILADRLDIEGKKLNIKVDAVNIEGKLTADQVELNGITFTEGSEGSYKNTEFVSDAIRFERGQGSHFIVEENQNGAPYGMDVDIQVGYGDAPVTLSMMQNGSTGSGTLGGAWTISVNGAYGPVDLVSWMQAIYEAFTGLQEFINTTSSYLNDHAMIACPTPSCSIDEGLIV